MSQATQEDLDRHNKIQAEIGKLMAETSKINKENQWYIAIVTSTVVLAIVAIVKVFL
ncbi:MAG: hypothetical protein QM478_11520 [Flavobacteriaceae bacterium]